MSTQSYISTVSNVYFQITENALIVAWRPLHYGDETELVTIYAMPVDFTIKWMVTVVLLLNQKDGP